MSVLVAQQDESIDYIQNTAHDIEQDASKGYVISGGVSFLSLTSSLPESSTQTRQWCLLEPLAKSDGSASVFSSSC